MIQGHQGPVLYFQESSLLKKLMGYKTRGQEISQQLTYRHSWRPFWTCPPDLPISLMTLFFPAGTKQNFWSLDYSPKYWTVRISRLSDDGLRNFTVLPGAIKPYQKNYFSSAYQHYRCWLPCMTITLSEDIWVPPELIVIKYNSTVTT